MKTAFIINAYRRPSRSARKLAQALHGRVVCVKAGDDMQRHSLRPSQPHEETVVNWGNGEGPSWYSDVNTPEAIRLASNKLKSFQSFAARTVPIPLFATSKDTVSWKGLTVVRHKLQGHSGEGIELIEHPEDLPEAPLYVQYIKKEQEYRIHVGRSNDQTQILAVQRKARDLSVPIECVDWKVRNHDNGFVFAREGANPNDDTLQAACNALGALGLDFGAVDIIYNQERNKAYVLEINTAPGLEGQTIEDYTNFFRASR